MTNTPSEQTPQPIRAAEDGVHGFTTDSHDELGELDIYEALIDPKAARAGKDKNAGGGGGGVMPMQAGQQGAQGAAAQGAAQQAAGAQAAGAQAASAQAAAAQSASAQAGAQAMGAAGALPGVAARAGMGGALGAGAAGGASAGGAAAGGALGGAAMGLGRLGAVGAVAGLGTSAVSGGLGTQAAGSQIGDHDGDGVPDNVDPDFPGGPSYGTPDVSDAWYRPGMPAPIGYDDNGFPIYDTPDGRYPYPSPYWQGDDGVVPPTSDGGRITGPGYVEDVYAGGGTLPPSGTVYTEDNTYYAGGTRTADSPTPSMPSYSTTPSSSGSYAPDLGIGGTMNLSVDQGSVKNQARVWDDWAADMAALVGDVDAANTAYTDFGMVTHPASSYQTNHRTLSTWTGNASTEFGNMSTTLHMTANEFAELEASGSERANKLEEQTTLPTTTAPSSSSRYGAGAVPM